MTRLSSLTKAKLLYSTGATLTGALAGSGYVFLVLLPTVLDAGGGSFPGNWKWSQIWAAAVVAVIAGAIFGLLCSMFGLACAYIARKLFDSPWLERAALALGVLLSTSTLYFMVFAGFNQIGLTIIFVIAAAVGIGASILFHDIVAPPEHETLARGGVR